MMVVVGVGLAPLMGKHAEACYGVVARKNSAWSRIFSMTAPSCDPACCEDFTKLTLDIPFQNTIQIFIKLYIPVLIYSTVASSFEVGFGTSMIGYYEARSRYHVHEIL